MTLINTTPIIQKLDTLYQKLGTDDAVARHLKVDPSYITNIRKGRRVPGPAILRELDMEKVITFTEKHE